MAENILDSVSNAGFTKTSQGPETKLAPVLQENLRCRTLKSTEEMQGKLLFRLLRGRSGGLSE